MRRARRSRGQGRGKKCAESRHRGARAGRAPSFVRACVCVCVCARACARECVCARVFARVSARARARADPLPLRGPGSTQSESRRQLEVGSMRIFPKCSASAASLVVLLGFYDASAFSLPPATSLQCLMYRPMSRSCRSRVECSGQASSNLGHSTTRSPRVVIVPNHVPDCTAPDSVIWYNWLKSELLCKNFAEVSSILNGSCSVAY